MGVEPAKQRVLAAKEVHRGLLGRLRPLVQDCPEGFGGVHLAPGVVRASHRAQEPAEHLEAHRVVAGELGRGNRSTGRTCARADLGCGCG